MRVLLAKNSGFCFGVRRAVDMAEALAGEPKCVFLTVGRLGLATFEVAPQHHYVVRSIDPPHELNLPDLLVDADLVLDCSDNRATRDLVNLCCRAAQVPLISGAAIRFEGQVMLFDWQPGTPCYRCFSRLFDEPEGSCVTNGVAGPLVGVVGSLQALEAVKWLTGSAIQHGGELLLVDGRSLTFDKMALRRDPCCPVCARSDEKRSGEEATSQLIC